MRVIKLTLAYDGTDFHGWQIQPRAPTIQGAVMDAVEQLIGERAQVDASGRTDAGVHALGQVASFRTRAKIPAANLVKALNSLLPPSIRVLEAQEAQESFHARARARTKTYRYRIYRGAVCPPSLWRYVHHFPYPLDEAAMIQAAPLLEGTHDFSAMASSEGHGDQERSNIRTIFLSELRREAEDLVYTVRGNGFLHHMVRNIAGTLLEVGKGRLAVASLPELLAGKNRSAAGPTLPGKGLWLVCVEY